MSIFTETFPQFVQDELKVRQDRLTDPDKRFELVNYQSTRNAFVRMTSGVNVEKGGVSDDGALAKRYVLQGGNLNNKNYKQGIRDSFDNNAYSSNSANAGAYARGIRPMPGITSITAECKTAYGSLIEATVKFTCWDIKQLEDLELLFMRPGYTVLLEWGWSYSGQQPQFYDILEQKNIDFQQAYKDIFQKCADNKGNYEAILGYVKNYQWSARPDGGYDCTTYIISLGEVLESLKINYAPFNINLEETDNIGILKTFRYSKSTPPLPLTHPNNPEIKEKIKDQYSKGILNGLLYEIQKFLSYPNENSPFKDADVINGEYPQLYIPFTSGSYEPISVFKKAWSFSQTLDTSKQTSTEDKFSYYITLESLCDLVNDRVIPRADKNILTKITTTNRNYQLPPNSIAQPLECIAHPFQISIDPTKCLISPGIWASGIPVTIDGTTTNPGAITPSSNKLLSEYKNILQNKKGLHYYFLKILDSKINNNTTANADISGHYNNTTVKDFSNIFKDIRNEIIWSISQINGNAYALFNGGTIYFDKCGTTKDNLSFDIIKFLKAESSEDTYNTFLSIIETNEKQYQENLKSNIERSKDNEVVMRNVEFSNTLRKLFLPGGIPTVLSTGLDSDVKFLNTSTWVDKTQSNKDTIISVIGKELIAKRLDYNNNIWGKTLIDNFNKNATTATLANAKESLKPLKSLKPYFTNDSYTKGNISNIYLNIGYLHQILTDPTIQSKDPSGKNTINLVDFFKQICQAIQESTGNINNFSVHIDGRDSIGRIVDLNITANTNKINLAQIELHNTKSTARSYKLESKIFPEQGAIIAISAQAYQLSGQLGYTNSTLTAYNQGITDRLKPRVSVENSEDGNDPNKLYNTLAYNFIQINKYFEVLKNYVPITYAAAGVGGVSPSSILPSSSNPYTPGNYSNALRDILGYFSALEKNSSQAFTGIIPVALSIDIDGIGGVVIGNLFKINDDVLPAGYKGTFGVGRQLGFLVKGFNQKVENNDWVTTIEAYPFLIPDLETTDKGFWYKFLKYGIDLGNVKRSERKSPNSLDNTPTAIQFFKGKGYSDEATAAIVGGLQSESFTTLDPTTENSGGAFGIAQWLGPRKAALLLKPNPDSLQTQLDFIIEEFKNTEKTAGTALLQAKTLEDAIVAASLYERYGVITDLIKSGKKPSEIKYNDIVNGREIGNRVQYAEKILKQLKSGAKTPLANNNDIYNFLKK